MKVGGCSTYVQPSTSNLQKRPSHQGDGLYISLADTFSFVSGVLLVWLTGFPQGLDMAFNRIGVSFSGSGSVSQWFRIGWFSKVGFQVWIWDGWIVIYIFLKDRIVVVMH